MKDILVLKDINKSYGRNAILKGLNMNVKKNEIYGFIGENGAGKSTTMRIIMSIVKQNSGQVFLFGNLDETNLSVSRRRIGAIIENPAFYPYLSAFDNLKYYLKFKGIPNQSTIKETLDIVGLGNVKKKKFKNFSLGMKQRLGLALSLLNSPDLLILDEPFNGLDPKGIVEFRETLRSLNKKYGITIIISSHNLNELEQIATCYGFINNGKIIQEISTEDLRKKCKNYITLEVDDVKTTILILERQFKYMKYEVIDENTLHLYDYDFTVESVISHLVSQSVRIRNIHESNVSLEEYFLAITKGEKK